MRPRVDVVVPCYKYARYLESCVGAILGQDGVDIRVLIIDDASPDDTEHVGRGLAAADSRVDYRRHPENRGHIATYNEGLLGWATGDYVLLISADDQLAPGALGRATSLLEQHPRASIAYGRQICFEAEPPQLTNAEAAGSGACRKRSGVAFITEVCESGHNPVSTPTAVVRTKAQHAVGGYEARLPHTADLEMWLRLATVGDVLELDALQAFKRHHGQNMQLAFLTQPERDIRERRAAFHIFFERFGVAVHGAERQLALAERALASELFWRAANLFDRSSVEDAEELLALASSIDPGIIKTPQWRRMSLKRRLGYRVWSMVQVLTGRGERPGAP